MANWHDLVLSCTIELWVSKQDSCIKTAYLEWSLAYPNWHHAWELFGRMLEGPGQSMPGNILPVFLQNCEAQACVVALLPHQWRHGPRSHPRLRHLLLKQGSGRWELVPRPSASFSLRVVDVGGFISDALLLHESSRCQARSARNTFCQPSLDLCHYWLLPSLLKIFYFV